MHAYTHTLFIKQFQETTLESRHAVKIAFTLFFFIIVGQPYSQDEESSHSLMQENSENGQIVHNTHVTEDTS